MCCACRMSLSCVHLWTGVMSIFASKHLFILLINCRAHFQFVRQFALAAISLLTLASARPNKRPDEL